MEKNGMNVLLFTTRLSIIACRHMVPLYYSGESIKAPELAQIYGFKTRSLSPSFTALTKVGILTSRVGGRYEDRGFIFAKDPKKISVYDIVKALEGDAIVECDAETLNCSHRGCRSCGIHHELLKVVNHRKKVLSATTIYDQYMKFKNIKRTNSSVKTSSFTHKEMKINHM